MLDNPTKQIDIDRAIWMISRKTIYHEIVGGNTTFRIDVYCDGEFVETIYRFLCRISRQWAVRFESRIYPIFMRDQRFAIEVEDRNAFKYTGTGSFPAESA